MKVTLNEMRNLIHEVLDELVGFEGFDTASPDPLAGLDLAALNAPASGQPQTPARASGRSERQHAKPGPSPKPTVQQRQQARQLVRTAQQNQPAGAVGMMENKLRNLIRTLVQEQMGNLPPRRSGASRLPPVPTEPRRDRGPQQPNVPPVPGTPQAVKEDELPAEAAITEMVRKIVRQTLHKK